MIQKIIPVTDSVKTPLRSTLKHTDSKLKYLAGSWGSGYNPPRFYDTEMVIPGGLDFKEKAYYLLKGKLPKSVYERWFPNDGSQSIAAGDQLVTVQRTYNGGIGDIVNPPHGVDTAGSLDVSDHGGMMDGSSGDSFTSGGSDGLSGDGSGLSDIFNHIFGS